MPVTTAAFLGAVGGAGTTRTTLEVGALLAADGHDVAVLDAAYDTQGLARYLPGRLDPDLTALVTDAAEDPLASTGVEPDWDLAGRLVCYPAHAPFERLARAKAPPAAEVLVERVREAAADADHVLLDVPPLGSNQAVAAVHAADRVVVVAPATAHGMDAVQSTRDRLRDVGAGPEAGADGVVAVAQSRGHARRLLGTGEDRGTGVAGGADVVVPWTGRPAPACLEDGAHRRACAEVVSLALDRELDLEGDDDGLLGGRLGSLAGAGPLGGVESVRDRLGRGDAGE